MKRLLPLLLAVLAGMLLCSCEPIEGLPVFMNWESSLTFDKNRISNIPAEAGVYEFTCTSHSYFGLRVSAGSDPSAYHNSLNEPYVFNGPWYEVIIHRNKMKVTVEANETGESRSLSLTTTAIQGSAAFYLIQEY